MALSACGEDSSSTSPSPSNNGTNNTDFSGTFKTNQTYIETDRISGAKDTTIYTDITFEVTGSSPDFTITDKDDANNTLAIITNGSSFNGSTATGEFIGSNYNGNLNGNLLTIDQTGADSTSTWTGQFLGTKQSSGGTGGGSGSNYLQIPGHTIGNVSGIVDCDTRTMNVVFETNDTNQWYDVIVEFNRDVDQLSSGTYNVKDGTSTLTSTDCNISISFQDINLGQDDNKSYKSINNGTGSVTISGGKANVVFSNVQMESRDSLSHTKSISIGIACQ